MTGTAVPRLLTAVGGLAVAFVVLSLLVAVGALHSLDAVVSSSLAAIWSRPLQPLFQGIALLGGVEATSLVVLAIFVVLWRRVSLVAGLAVGAFFGAVVIELAFKRFFIHPGPPPGISHPDGPSLSDLADSSLQLQASFPSGHMTRTVIVYGLLAFVVTRLAPDGPARRLAFPIAVALCLLMAFDRVYLEVHWASDVLGGVILGLLALVVSITWLETRGGTAVE